MISNGVADPPTQSQLIKDLASAILQVSQAIDDRYLKKPLVLDEKDKRKADEKEKEKEGLSVMERWQISLMSSTSFSQLYLHFSTLGKSLVSPLSWTCRAAKPL